MAIKKIEWSPSYTMLIDNLRKKNVKYTKGNVQTEGNEQIPYVFFKKEDKFAIFIKYDVFILDDFSDLNQLLKNLIGVQEGEIKRILTPLSNCRLSLLLQDSL